MGAEIRIEGIDVLQRKLRDIGADVHKELSDAGKKGMLVLEGEIKRRAPVETGNLRDSYNTQVSDERDGIVVTTGTNVAYAPYLEYGTGIYAENGTGRQEGWFYVDAKGEGHFTRGGKPQPHVRPALDQTEDQIGKVVRAELEKELRRRSM